MSRGGTKKARAAREAERRKREKLQQRQQKVKAKPKSAKTDEPKVGKGRAFLIHLAAMPAPFILSFGLVLSANVTAEGLPRTGDYWLAPLVGDANASYISEPGGLLLVAALVAITIAVFFLAPVMVWRYVYRDWDVVRRDRSAVDNSFTLIMVAVVLWIVRAIIGYTTVIHGLVQLLVLLSVYIPFFSGVLGVIIPSIPGSGRVGGILPDFMKIPFTEKMLLTEPEQQEVRAAATAAKEFRRQQYDLARAERANRKKRKK